MKKKTILSIAGATLVGAALLAWAFAPRPVEVETAVVSQGRFEQSIEEDGQTRVKDRYSVHSPVAARLMRISLREGDAVKAGDTIAVLLPVMSAVLDERAAREATARLNAATAGIQRARARSEAAKVSVQRAQLELQRNEQLAREGFVAPAALDSARLALAAAQRELDAAGAERQMAVQEQAQAAAALQPVGAARTGQPLNVRAPVSGVVLKVAQPSEATLPAGSDLMDIGDPRQMEVVAELLTTDAVQAQPGRRAVIERWGGPPVQGHVRRVEPGAFTKVSALGIEEQRVKVLIDIDSPPPEWAKVGDGFRVTARIITQSVDQAVLVPVGALFPFADGGTAVYRFDNGRARLQLVELGGRNSAEGWVKSGLSVGQNVIIYPPPSVMDGKRVKPRKP